MHRGFKMAKDSQHNVYVVYKVDGILLQKSFSERTICFRLDSNLQDITLTYLKLMFEMSDL